MILNALNAIAIIRFRSWKFKFLLLDKTSDVANNNNIYENSFIINSIW